MRRLFTGLMAIATGFVLLTSGQAQGQVKVFLMAGQSNMQGHGRIETGNGGAVGAIGSLRYLVNEDLAKYGHLGDGAGNWNTRSDVWVWNRNGTDTGKTTGDLGVQFGVDSARFGPEVGFGSVVGDAFDEQVVLVKTSWGGKSLAVDFRPPSAVDDRGGVTGSYYNLMISSYEEALVDIAAQFPGQNIKLAGFAWHQGWNDRVNQSYNDEYEANMVDFIGDVRERLLAPDLPFVIGETGMTGYTETHPRALSLMAAQNAMEDFIKYPQHNGNVDVIGTQGFWRDSSVSPNSQGYHWNGNGESYYLIGESMGEAMVGMVAQDPEPSSLALLGFGGLLLLSRRRRGC